MNLCSYNSYGKIFHTFDEWASTLGKVVIRYDNETYFQERITMLTFDSDRSGYCIAKLIKDFKNNIKQK